MTEYEDAIRLANHILDRPSGDPDDDLAVLSRQFLRALERVERIRAEAEAAILLAAADRCEAWAIKNYMDDFGSFVARNVAVNLRDEIKALQSPDAAAALTRRDAETRLDEGLTWFEHVISYLKPAANSWDDCDHTTWAKNRMDTLTRQLEALDAKNV